MSKFLFRALAVVCALGLVFSVIRGQGWLQKPEFPPAVPAAKPASDPIGELIRSWFPDQPAKPKKAADPVDPRCRDELSWLACAIYFEARGESLEGQRRVALSILKRVKDRRWPNTIERVVRQREKHRNRCQYSFRCDGKPDRITEELAWTVALFIAEKAMQERSLGCAHSYHADQKISPRSQTYFKTLARHEQVGAHIFYCDK